MHTATRRILSVACLVAVAGAKDIGYIFELDLFSSLAPCAASAINDGFGPETYTTKCGQEETALQKCICSNTAERREVAATVASSVSYSCGSVGTDDQWSASKVVDQYCNPTETITFAKPSEDVQAYVMEIPEISNLPKCAQSGIGWALGPVSAKCPEAANLWAPCACSKKGVADEFRSTVSESARSYCSNAEDASSALSFVDAYCNMNKGTTSFGQPAGPPGDMTYYITALPQFNSLRPCAQAGLSSVVQLQTDYYCATGPQALASCVCLKSRFAQGMSASVTSGIKETCSSTASDDVASALKVFEYYCQAAEKKVVASVTESISQSYPTAQSRTGSVPSSPASTETGQTGSHQNPSDQKKAKKRVGAAVIAASVLGMLIALGLVVGLIVFIRRKRVKQDEKTAVSSQGEGQTNGNYHNELDPTSKTPSSELDAKSPATAVSTLVSPQSATENAAEISPGVPGYAVYYYKNSPVHEAASTNTHGPTHGQHQNSYGRSYELDSGVPYQGR